ncbi:hypothetical protein [Rhizobium vallis]|uniref:hypothetical protein n=1 Tax=Rhizobium vallis TaxID=634290 RepID=UPI000F87A110|nr:hypothetical protein [Rhizobium vallis]
MSKVECHPKNFTADHRTVASDRLRNMVRAEGGRFAEMTAEQSEEIIDLIINRRRNAPAISEGNVG